MTNFFRRSWVIRIAGTVLAVALVGLAEAGCSLAFGQPDEPSPLPQLVGKWQNIRVSSVQYRDTVTGSFAPPSGTGMIYTIRADGTYTSAETLQTTLYSCTSSFFFYAEGTFTASATSIKFREQKRQHQFSDTCGKSDPQPVKESPGTDTYSWRITTEDGKTWLLLTKPGESGDLSFEKEKEEEEEEEEDRRPPCFWSSWSTHPCL